MKIQIDCLPKPKFLFLSFLVWVTFQSILLAQNPNLKYIHWLEKNKNSEYSKLKDSRKLYQAYEKIKKYETIQPQTPVDKLCEEIENCKGKSDTENLKKLLAYTNHKDLLECFEKNDFKLFVEGYSDGCCAFEDSYKFQVELIKDWSVETILILQSIVYFSELSDSSDLSHYIEVLLVDKDIIKSTRNGYSKP